MNNNANKLSSDYYYPADREKLAITAVEYLIKYPDIYNQAKDKFGHASMESIIEIGEKRNSGAK